MNFIKLQTTLLLAISIISTHSFAASFNSYYCPKTYRTVKVGDPMDTIRQACGQPTSQVTKQVQVNNPLITTQWLYNIGEINVKGTSVSAPGLAITFRDQQVIKIENNAAASAASVCGGGNINIGDDVNKVLLTCGRPSAINTQQEANTTTKEITEWTYSFGPYQPQIIFNFEGGVVTQISSGTMGS